MSIMCHDDEVKSFESKIKSTKSETNFYIHVPGNTVYYTIQTLSIQLHIHNNIDILSIH